MNSQPQIAWLLQQILDRAANMASWAEAVTSITVLVPSSLLHIWQRVSFLALLVTSLHFLKHDCDVASCGVSAIETVSMLPTHLFFFGASMFPPAPQINLYFLAISTQIQYFMPILQSFATHFINWRQNGKQRRDWFGASFELLIGLRKINFIVCPRHLQFGFWGWWNIWLYLMFFITFLIKWNQSHLIHWIHPQRNPFHCYQSLSLPFPGTLRGRQSQQCYIKHFNAFDTYCEIAIQSGYTNLFIIMSISSSWYLCTCVISSMWIESTFVNQYNIWKWRLVKGHCGICLAFSWIPWLGKSQVPYYENT